MTLLNRVKDLCAEKKISQRRLEKDLGISNGSSSKWEKSSPGGDVLDKLSDYFAVSVDYLLGKSEYKTVDEMLQRSNISEGLTSKNEKDIAKTMDAILNQLDNQDALMFDGEPLDDDSRELLKASLENSVRTAKLLAKQKFTPNKYKK